jgi:uncharacterized protein YlxW (UPF0749 family)
MKLAPTICALLLATSAGTIRAQETASEQSRLARAELLAGLTPVEGPGLVVTLRDSPRQAPRGVDRKNLLLHDTDVNAVLNALRAGGAEALAIGGAGAGEPERLLASSATVGSATGLTVNGTALRAPYRVLAIGDAAGMQEELFRAGGVVKEAGLDILKMIELRREARLQLPAAREPGTFRFARAVGPRIAASTAPEEVHLAVQTASPKPAPVKPVAGPAVLTETGRSQSPGVGVAVFGGRDLAKYHRAGCRFGERIGSAERVTFHSARDAEKAGRVPCRVCRP